MTHDNPHPLQGQSVFVRTAKHPQIGDGPHLFRIEDWWDRLTGGSWMHAKGNPAALIFAMRTGFAGSIALDDEVVYGKIGRYGHLVHVTEIIKEESHAK